jgi:hypothetical protein
MQEAVIRLTGVLPRLFAIMNYQYLSITAHHQPRMNYIHNPTSHHLGCSFCGLPWTRLCSRFGSLLFSIILQLFEDISLPLSMSHELRVAAEKCIEQFKLLIEISAVLDPVSDTEDSSYGTSWIEEQYVRFKIWAGNIGAFAQGHASLDYRLRDSFSTQKFMLFLLIALADFIHRGK